MESVVLTVDGQQWDGWTEMSVTSSLEAIAGEFDLTVTTQWSDASPRYQAGSPLYGSARRRHGCDRVYR
jgi:prophage tail gpP-like protein